MEIGCRVEARGHSVFTRIQEYWFSPSVIHQLGEGEDKEHWWNKGWVHITLGALWSSGSIGRFRLAKR